MISVPVEVVIFTPDAAWTASLKYNLILSVPKIVVVEAEVIDGTIICSVGCTVSSSMTLKEYVDIPD